jgi:hypothetical protein
MDFGKRMLKSMHTAENQTSLYLKFEFGKIKSKKKQIAHRIFREPNHTSTGSIIKLSACVTLIISEINFRLRASQTRTFNLVH